MIYFASQPQRRRAAFELARPPRFFKEQITLAGGTKTANYVYTTDFTSGQASQVSRHILYFAAGIASVQAEAMKKHGLPIHTEGAARGADAMGGSGMAAAGGLLRGAGGPVGAHANSVALRQPPTSSTKHDAGEELAAAKGVRRKTTAAAPILRLEETAQEVATAEAAEARYERLEAQRDPEDAGPGARARVRL